MCRQTIIRPISQPANDETVARSLITKQKKRAAIYIRG